MAVVVAWRLLTLAPMKLRNLTLATLSTALLVASVGLAKDAKTVAVTVDGKGFHPSHIEVDDGTPLTLKFTRTSDKTCAKEVVFPEIDVEKPLPLNQPVTLTVPTDKTRTLTFQCGMGMYESKLVIR